MNSAIKDSLLFKKLIHGNLRFQNGESSVKPVHFPFLRQKLTLEGQKPNYVVLACADSRVPVEKIFDVSLGEIFTLRVAGNILTDEIFASVEYAIHILEAQAIVILGHTNCGAIQARLSKKGAPFASKKIHQLLEKIHILPHRQDCIESQTKHHIQQVSNQFKIHPWPHHVEIFSGLYRTDSGKVEWMEL